MTSRRDFLRRATRVGGALLAARLAPADALAAAVSQARTPLNILVLGGTGYIGPHLVRHAVARGHKVSIFTRGRRDADIPASVERIVGDRAISDSVPRGNLTALERRRWDVVIDDSATDPRWVAQSTALLRDSGLYMFVSSTGVFDPYLTDTLDEAGPVRVEPANSREFAVQKAQCEKIVLETFGDRGIVVRPTYIVGPGDNSDRFPYWPQRLARGGEVLAPGKKSDPVQIIDVRDLVEFQVKLAEDRKTGIYNVAGPRAPLSMEDFLARSCNAVGPNARLVWIEDYEFLTAQRISAAIPWLMLRGNYLYSTSIKNAKAVAAGLGFRPLEDTVRDTLAWWATVPEARRNAPRFWITPDREREVLELWKRRGA